MSYDFDGQLLWERRLPLTQNIYGAVASPIVAAPGIILDVAAEKRNPDNGRLYTVQNGGIVFSRVAKTGELIYSGRTGAMGYYYSSPVAAGNKIYLGSEEGLVVVLAGGEH